MENELICLDSSVLIDYFRKSNKDNSLFVAIAKRKCSFTVSVVTEFEIYAGSNPSQQVFWDVFFQKITILPFDIRTNAKAIEIYKPLKSNNQLIDLPDLFIGATALAHNLKLATLNEKHFSRIQGLELLTKN